MSYILTPRRPATASLASLEHSLRRADDRLAEINLVKATYRALTEAMIANARRLGATEAEARVARDSAADVLSDLFWDIEQSLQEETERDEHLLSGE